MAWYFEIASNLSPRSVFLNGKGSCRSYFPAANLLDMAGTGKKFDSLRLNRFYGERLALALAISLAAHLLGWGGYEANKYFGWSQRLHWPVWLHRAAKIKQPPPVQNNDQQLTFIEVEQPAAEAPKNAKFYSSQNSRAANPKTDQDTGQPKLNGEQTEVAKTKTVTHPDFNKLQPAPAPSANEPQKPRPAVHPGDLAFVKPEELQKPQRPRTVRQARALNHLPGLKMRQDGGVHRVALEPSFDAKATPFGQYDAALVEAVTQHWYDLLDSQRFAMDRTGKVTLQFHLNYDGSISDVKVLENTVGDLLGYVCRDAITEPAPFAPWPEDMRRMVGKNYREITFTFYYY
ncbi:MAG: hypothetical protein ACREFE_03345 [Limisphaerales bacterium]